MYEIAKCVSLCVCVHVCVSFACILSVRVALKVHLYIHFFAEVCEKLFCLLVHFQCDVHVLLRVCIFICKWYFTFPGS